MGVGRSGRLVTKLGCEYEDMKEDSRASVYSLKFCLGFLGGFPPWRLHFLGSCSGSKELGLHSALPTFQFFLKIKKA